VHTLDNDTDRLAVAIIRGIAMDAPLHAKSGHQGTAMSLAPLGHVLYSRVMRHFPGNPHWVSRDRFILSNGHASILQYALLFLNGYGLERDDLLAFRSWDSRTPGHPEAGHTPGIEVTTGPLGQGFANAVGMAIAERNLRSRFGDELMDHHTWVVAGDGCLMEGISHEAASLAGHLGLDRLVCIFDDNRITIDGSTDLACSDDVPMRFRSYGWNVIEVGELGDDLDALEAMLLEAKNHRGQPTLCVLRTRIGVPSPDFTDRHEAHGNPFTTEHVTRTKQAMGIPDEPFWAPDSVVETLRHHAHRRGAALQENYQRQSAGCDRSTFDACFAPVAVERVTAPQFDAAKQLATRQAIVESIVASTDAIPGLLIGSADLTGNTGTRVSSFNAHTRTDPSGQQVYFGIREHAMGAALVGAALHGGVVPVGGTFFVFSDYMKPAIRLAALSQARCIFVFSHDSVGVGEDGPTHQPIEHLAALRSMPGLQVIRPADANETHRAWLSALRADGPTALILSRQNLQLLTDGNAVDTGAAEVGSEAEPDLVLIGTGSEVSTCVTAAALLRERGVSTRIVSMPDWRRFDAQPVTFRETLLPPHLPTISVEAASTFGWSRYAHRQVGIDRFGASAPGSTVLEQLGISPTHVEAVAIELLETRRHD
jgi:transketolase